MHQPDYRDHASGEFLLPWVYLHAIKDYTDMAHHLEQHSQIKAVVNFVPVLLDQLEDYQQQFASGHIRDPLLRLLARENLDDLSAAERELVLDSCFRSNHHKMVAPYPAYKRLSDLFKMLETDGSAALTYLSGQYYADLLTWYHLAWCGESVRREHELAVKLMSQGEGFDHAERKQLFDLIGQLIAGIIPRYRKLAESGQIELSTTPHYHPLAPLLLDFNSARESAPDSSLPQSQCYPGGKSRVLAHLLSAQESHRARFGITAQGVWPAEGALSTALLEVLAEHECRWVASGEGVLANSLHAVEHPLPERSHYLYRPYHVQGAASGVHCFFRDDRLSDLIGFEYSRWNGKDAALNFVAQLEEIAMQAPADETPLVSIILDGENAWEYYPYNAYHFLSDLYSSPDKNRAWDLLCVAKQSYDLIVAGGHLSEAEMRAAEKQLASCESSDWFWWFGDYNPSHAVESFDRLYRHNLMHLYQLLKLAVPAALNNPISHGGGEPETGGAMRRAS